MTSLPASTYMTDAQTRKTSLNASIHCLVACFHPHNSCTALQNLQKMPASVTSQPVYICMTAAQARITSENSKPHNLTALLHAYDR